MQQIEETGKFSSIIQDNQMLWGILLGYGVHNSKLYYERTKLDEFIYFEELPKIPKMKPLPSSPFSSIEEECEYFYSLLKPFGEYNYSPLIIRPVHFMADHNHPETEKLKNKYNKLRSKISAIYAQGDFLEITLSQLTSSEKGNCDENLIPE